MQPPSKPNWHWQSECWRLVLLPISADAGTAAKPVNATKVKTEQISDKRIIGTPTLALPAWDFKPEIHPKEASPHGPTGPARRGPAPPDRLGLNLRLLGLAQSRLAFNPDFAFVVFEMPERAFIGRERPLRVRHGQIFGGGEPLDEVALGGDDPPCFSRAHCGENHSRTFPRHASAPAQSRFYGMPGACVTRLSRGARTLAPLPE